MPRHPLPLGAGDPQVLEPAPAIRCDCTGSFMLFQAEIFLAGVQQTWRIMCSSPLCKHFFPCLKAVIISPSAFSSLD